jgi:CRP-like cAMP-binding protein
LIDRIRNDIQQRLDELLNEADKLRRALSALDPRGKQAPKSTPRPAPKSAQASAPAASAPAPAAPAAPAAPPKRAQASKATGSRARTAPGATKAKVLGALSADSAMTAGDVANATGLARGTVSTTLSKLAKSGEVAKADRGYRLPAAS